MEQLEINPEFLTVDQVCIKLQLSRPSVYALFKKGTLKPITFGSCTRIRASDLEKIR